MSTPLTLEQLTEDQAHHGAEHLATQSLMTNLLKALDPALAADVLERTKGELMLAQGMATAAIGTGYVEDAILMVEQIEAAVVPGKRSPPRQQQPAGAVPFDFSRLHRPQTGA